MADCSAVFGKEAWSTVSIGGRFAICARSLVAANFVWSESDGNGAGPGCFTLAEAHQLAGTQRVDCGGRDGAGLARIWRGVFPASGVGRGAVALVCKPTG